METAPARIFVLWHPDFDLGKEIAQNIFRWFRTDEAHGIPVYYRSQAAPNGTGLPLPIPSDSKCLTFVILLAEVKMVRDRLWRAWLTTLPDPNAAVSKAATNEKKARKYITNPPILLPVALHPTAYNLPGPIRQLNYISPLSGEGRNAKMIKAGLESILTPLRKDLMEVLARTVIEKFPEILKPSFLKRIKDLFLSNFKEPLRTKIFISHAKRDGTDVAKKLRDYIYQETQLTAFFDQNDIALGYKFANVLEKALKSDSAAMLVVNGDHYAERPWCRREIQIFSRPHKSKRFPQVWEKPPVLIIQAMKGGLITSSVPEFANATVLRWREGDAGLCIDTLLREAIFRAYHSAFAGAILSKGDAKVAEGRRIYINWRPDPLSLREVIIRATAAANAVEKNSKEKKPSPVSIEEIVYPGRELSSVELCTFKDYFPELRLLSFNQIRMEKREMTL